MTASTIENSTIVTMTYDGSLSAEDVQTTRSTLPSVLVEYGQARWWIRTGSANSAHSPDDSAAQHAVNGEDRARQTGTILPIPHPDRHTCRLGPARSPPSTGRVWPVIQAASSEARNAIAAAMSAGSPTRSSG